MVEKQARRAVSQRDAVKKIREGETFVVNLPFVGQVEVPGLSSWPTTAVWPHWPHSN